MGDYCFYGMNIETLSRTDQIIEYGNYSLSNCHHLKTHIKIRNGARLKSYVTGGCSDGVSSDSVIEIILGNNLQINPDEQELFFGCHIRKINRIDTLDYIGYGWFHNCVIDEPIRFKPNATIGNRAFYDTRFNNCIEFHENIIGNNAFERSIIHSLRRFDTITKLGTESFKETSIHENSKPMTLKLQRDMNTSNAHRAFQ